MSDIVESQTTALSLKADGTPFGYQSIESQGHDIASAIDRAEDGGYLLTGTTTGIILSSEEENALHVGMHCYAMHYTPHAETWTWVQKYGAYKKGKPVATSCSSVIRMGSSNKFAIAGYTEGISIFSPKIGTLRFSSTSEDLELDDTKITSNAINGFVVVLEIPKDGEDPILVAGKMLARYKVNYPVKLAAIRDNSLVVASMVTDNDSPNLEAALRTHVGELSELEPDKKIGNLYSVQVQKFTVEKDNAVLSEDWSQTFATDDGRGASVSGLVYDEFTKSITITGSTNGQGEAFGQSEDEKIDFDGYVTSLYEDHGRILSKPNHELLVKRLESLPGKDEFVRDICSHGRAIYIVGTTNSIIESGFSDSLEAFSDGSDERPLNAFIQKRVLGSLLHLWTRQISLDYVRNNENGRYINMEGLGCQVASDLGLVYVSGSLSVKDNSNDLFLAAFQQNLGQFYDSFPNVYSIGTSRDESFAGITSDDYGAAIVYGTTDGSLISKKPSGSFLQYADSFLISFSAKEASHVHIIDDGIVTGSLAKVMSLYQRTDTIKILTLALLISTCILLLMLASFNCYLRRRNKIQHTRGTAPERDADIVIIDDSHNHYNKGELYNVGVKMDNASDENQTTNASSMIINEGQQPIDGNRDDHEII